jgi:hypothetical protein
MKHGRFFIFVIVTIIATTSYSYSQENIVPVNELIDIAKDSLIAKNQLLVNGYSDKNLENHPLASSYQATFSSDSKEILKRRDSLIANNQDYSNFQTELTVKEKQISETEALIKASEHTVLRLHKADTNPLAPKTSEYVHEHLFTFVYTEDGQWELASDELLNMPAPFIPTSKDEAFKVDREPTVLAENYIPEDPSPSVSKEKNFKAYATIDRAAIVRYSEDYWYNYNPDYKDFGEGKDCTNFVSQALTAGGWPHIYGWYTNDDVWFYDYWETSLNSYTWAGAHNFYLFMRQTSRAYEASTFEEMQPGDILQHDCLHWVDGEPVYGADGYIDHSMIVAKKDDDTGTIYLTYHSPDSYEIPINRILQKYKDYTTYYYGWRLNDSFED